MRRKERQVTDFSEILSIVERCSSIRLAMVDDGKPYIVPLNFGYQTEGETLTFYFHSAKAGRKMDILKKNPQVCFEMDCGTTLRTHESNPCVWTTYYESIIGEGSIDFVEDDAAKTEALTCLMRCNGYEGSMDFNPGFFKAIAVYKLKVDAMTAKRNAPKEA